MESSPKGPLIWTVDVACVRLLLAFKRASGGVTVKVTSGGMDKGADPILERHGEVVAKVRDDEGAAAGFWKAGRRKEGIEAVEE